MSNAVRLSGHNSCNIYWMNYISIPAVTKGHHLGMNHCLRGQTGTALKTKSHTKLQNHILAQENADWQFC